MEQENKRERLVGSSDNECLKPNIINFKGYLIIDLPITITIQMKFSS